MERSYADLTVLHAQGDRIRILRLQGFIFFGTAYPLLQKIRAMLDGVQEKRPVYIVFDFASVSGLDSSSVMSITKMRDLIRSRGAEPLLVGLHRKVRALLAEGGCLPSDVPCQEMDPGVFCREFPDLDYAVGWCEEQILAQDAAGKPSAGESLAGHLAGLFPRPELLPRLVEYLERIDAAPGQELCRQGDAGDSLYFVESGEVSALLGVGGNHTPKRLRTMGPGSVVGEMAMHLETARSATIVADNHAVLYRLTRDALRRLETQDLELAGALHAYFVRLLAARLAHANAVVAQLMG